MSRESDNVDYSKISREHKSLARRLVSPDATTAEWEKFYAEIHDIVTKRYAEKLDEQNGLSVDDFIKGELTAFLRENNCERLCQFLNLKSDNSENHHFFGSWFDKVLKSAMATALSPDKRETSGDVEIERDSRGKNVDSKRTLMDGISSDERFMTDREDAPLSLAKLLKKIGGESFSRLIAKFWKKNPQETYIILMDAQLNFRYRKIAALLGQEEVALKTEKDKKKDEISIAGKKRNYLRKLHGKLTLNDICEMFPELKKLSDKQLNELLPSMKDKWSDKAYGADGNEDVDLVEEMGCAYQTLYFKGGRRTATWNLELKMPFRVSDKALIRGILTDGKGGVPEGTLFCCGKKRKVRANGHFEFTVSEFKKASDTSEVHFTFADNNQVDGIPYVPDEFDECRLTPELMERWARRKISDTSKEEVVFDLLNDFGFVLPQLILRDSALIELPFAKFGVPIIDRKHLCREYNEAFVLFKTDMAVDPDSPLSPDGFMLPLEWRYNPYAAEMPCNILPLHLSSLSRRVMSKMNEAQGLSGGEDVREAKWQINPSTRFFDDRVDFSAPGLFGEKEDDIASATIALAVSLRYAQKEIKYRGWTYSSIKYNFADGRPEGVGGICQKMALASTFGAERIIVSPDQKEIPVGDTPCVAQSIKGTELSDIADEVAFAHLTRLKPTWPVQFKTVQQDLFAPRRKTVKELFEMMNKEVYLEDVGTFVVLFGGPGMGKSVLMGLLAKRCRSHKAIGFVCQAGRPNQGWEFVKSLAHGIVCTFGEATDELLSQPIPQTPPHGEALRQAYRMLVVEPLTRIMSRRKSLKLFVLIDGLDEDTSGEVMALLLDERLRLPRRVGITVSTRHIVQDEDRLDSCATDVVDLDEVDTERARDVRMDVRTYIDQWTYTNPAVYDKLLRSNIDSEILKERILAKDKSFLYASFVLTGIADGRYSIETVEELEEKLPNDLKRCFYDAFMARFPTAEAYARVRPLLQALVKKGRITIADASKRRITGGEPLAAILKALRGYAIEEDGELSLSSETLRMWLGDAAHNAEFGA